VQAGDRREVRHAILYHKLGRKNCPSVSLRGVGADRAKAGGALHLQSYEEKVPGPGELLGSTGGNGWPGPAADAAVVARLGADQGRSGCDRESHAPADPQPGRSEEHTSELQSLRHLVCRLLLEKKKK